jgi:hypothetical protein
MKRKFCSEKMTQKSKRRKKQQQKIIPAAPPAPRAPLRPPMPPRYATAACGVSFQDDRGHEYVRHPSVRGGRHAANENDMHDEGRCCRNPLCADGVIGNPTRASRDTKDFEKKVTKRREQEVLRIAQGLPPRPLRRPPLHLRHPRPSLRRRHPIWTSKGKCVEARCVVFIDVWYVCVTGKQS